MKIRIDSPVALSDLVNLLAALNEKYQPQHIFSPNYEYVQKPEVHFFEKSLIVEVGRR